MPQVIGVRFRDSAKVYYFSPEGATGLAERDYVIVETARGQEAGIVAFAPREVSEEEIPGKLKGILRLATAVDLTEMERYRQREKRALVRCRDKVTEYRLAMKVVRAEYNFNGTYLTFYFTAEKRVDFRALVKDLARTFRTRIELHQIGVRDEVKLLGGHGLCGRPHCCATWLAEFRPISIRMAKQQDLPLSPMEISGVCGRLLCCLAYENELYAQVKQEMPEIGSMVQSPRGMGRVISVNVPQETITVRLEDEVICTFDPQELDQSVEQTEEPLPRRARKRRR
jgi:cell fate regulator YaaT (PSP1 superfamily)